MPSQLPFTRSLANIAFAQDTSMKVALQGSLSRPLLLACGSSLLAIPTLGTPARPYLDGQPPVPWTLHARFAPNEDVYCESWTVRVGRVP